MAACPFEEFVSIIAGAAEVHTDRLHVMIMDSLLGKKIFAYGTAYSKLEQIYHHSIQSWAEVTFVAQQNHP